MRKILWIIAVIIFVSVTVLIKTQSPAYLRHRILESVRTRCPRCQIDIGKVEILFFQAEVILTNLNYIGNPADTTTVDFDISKLIVDFHVMSLLTSSPSLLRVELDGATIKVADDDLKPATKGPKNLPWINKLAAFSMDELKIHNSLFVYTLITNGKNAVISVHKVNGEVTAFGTRPELSPRFVDFKIDALLEKSGIVKLNGTVDLFGTKNHDQINIEVRKQVLEELNQFFYIEDGIKLSGQLDRGLTNLHLSEGHLTGTFEASYHDFSIHYDQTRDRSSLTTFLSRIIASVTIAKKRPEDNKPPPVVQILRDRNPEEGLIKFLLAGLKEGAQKIITRKE